jgi:hypothetical protein
VKIYDYIDSSNVSTYNKDLDITLLDRLMDMNDVFDIYNSRKDVLYDIKPIKKMSMAYKYLKFERNISNFTNIYEGILKVTDKWREPVIIILNRYNDYLLGFQVRNMRSEKTKRIYKIYDFQSVYNYVNKDNPINDEDALPYNKLSHMYNVLNVDFNSEITIFEGYLDSVFFPNSIGVTGTESDISILTDVDDSLNIRFFYDNDDAGLRKSMSKIDSGYSVFLWKKLFNDMSGGNQSKVYKLSKRIKDLNDLVNYTKDPDVFNTLNLNNYFSIDEFDKMYL